MSGGAPAGAMRSTPMAASSRTFSSIALSALSKSFRSPSLIPTVSGTTPIPSGSRRMVSSRDPGRCVGLISPIVPRQLLNAMLNLLTAVDGALETRYSSALWHREHRYCCDDQSNLLWTTDGG